MFFWWKSLTSCSGLGNLVRLKSKLLMHFDQAESILTPPTGISSACAQIYVRDKRWLSCTSPSGSGPSHSARPRVSAPTTRRELIDKRWPRGKAGSPAELTRAIAFDRLLNELLCQSKNVNKAVITKRAKLINTSKKAYRTSCLNYSTKVLQ